MNRSFFRAVLVMIFPFQPMHGQDLTQTILDTQTYAGERLAGSVVEVKSPAVHPVSTKTDGTWQTGDRGGWTSGFFSGCLWLAYETSADPRFKTWAEQWTADLESQKNNTGDHDVGFRILCSYGNGHRLTGREDYRQVILTAANSLATRFNEQVGCIRSWNSYTFPVIIDNMMNLELLFWSSRNGGPRRHYDIAVRHAERTMQEHVRANGSTYHVVDFNPDGTVRSKVTAQGYGNESTWSRGQAWGLYGFTVAYRETREPRFLATAIRLADYYIDHLPADFVPYSDFDAPNIPACEKDASSAAIACSGLLELSGYVSDYGKYRNAAVNILKSLTGSNYLTKELGISSILRRGSIRWGDMEKGLIYADYYFLEAMRRFQASPNRVRTELLPEPTVLLCGYPNPFNASVTIEFRVPRSGMVSLNVFDGSGRRAADILDGFRSEGLHREHWDARDLTAGVYFVRIQGEGFSKTERITFIK